MRNLLPLTALILFSSGCIVVTANHCVDGVRNGSESDIDCGGTCGACNTGERCLAGSDCVTGVCTAGICGGQAPLCSLPTQAASTANYPLFTVRVNSSTAIPGTVAGFGVTAGQQGAYTVSWTDGTAGGTTCLAGILRATGGFAANSVTKMSGQETVTVTTDNMEVRFASQPGTDLDGVTVVTNGDPLYLDAYVNGSLSGARIYYTDVSSVVQQTTGNPASFSP